MMEVHSVNHLDANSTPTLIILRKLVSRWVIRGLSEPGVSFILNLGLSS